MFSLDSDTVNLSLRGQPAITRRIEAADSAELSICTIVVEEVTGGQISQINTLRSRNRSVGRESQFLANLIRSLSTLQILSYTDEAEQLYQSWTAKQKRVGPNDCRIAASAILAGFTVITCNGKDFSTIPSLKWQDWSQP